MIRQIVRREFSDDSASYPAEFSVKSLDLVLSRAWRLNHSFSPPDI